MALGNRSMIAGRAGDTRPRRAADAARPRRRGDRMMRRREFITLAGGAVAAWPFAALAQRGAEVVPVGVLAKEPWPPLEGLRDGMRALGYIDERGLHFEHRFAEGRAERYHA